MTRSLLPFFAWASLAAAQQPATVLASRVDPIIQDAVQSGLDPRGGSGCGSRL